MSRSSYTHGMHFDYRVGRCHIQWNGPRGGVRAEGPDGQVMSWPESENSSGVCLLHAMQWCRKGCIETKTEPAKPRESARRATKQKD